MTLSEFFDGLKDSLASKFPGLPIIIENKGDIQTGMEEALAKQGMYVLMRIPDYAFRGMNADSIVYDVYQLQLSVVENVIVNRSSINISDIVYGKSAQEVALQLANFMQFSFQPKMNLDNIHVDYIDNLFVADVYFNTTLALSDK